ncbi:MAG: hypothetical protein ACTSVU_04015 [Promethearchaeota archaeon]
MASIWLVIVYLLIAVILLWLALWLSTRIFVGKNFAKEKKFILLLSSLLIVVIVPLVTGGLIGVLKIPGDLMVSLRDLLGGGGHNYVTNLAPIISFILVMVILKLLVRFDWGDCFWVAIIGIFLLFLLYSLVPELDFLGAMQYTV